MEVILLFISEKIKRDNTSFSMTEEKLEKSEEIVIMLLLVIDLLEEEPVEEEEDHQEKREKLIKSLPNQQNNKPQLNDKL